MEIYPRGKMKGRLLIYGGIALAVYGWLWWCTRAFWLPPSGKPAGDLAAIEARQRACVQQLAGTLGERNLYKPQELARAAEWIEAEWKAQGYAITRQEYTTHDVTFRNMSVELGPPGPIVVIGAHYDTAMAPGADDNGSGVAALLEVSRALQGAKLAKRLRFCAFTNEEPPFFDTADMGSRRYALAAQARGDPIELMISLESLAYYDDRPKSQRYPFGLGHFYPDVGNFVGVVGNVSSRSLVSRVASLLAENTDVPVHCGALPGRLPGIFWSDHSPFWDIGVSALMVTDTARFRNPNYHTYNDLPNTLDYPRLARVTAGMIAVVRALAGA